MAVRGVGVVPPGVVPFHFGFTMAEANPVFA